MSSILWGMFAKGLLSSPSFRSERHIEATSISKDILDDLVRAEEVLNHQQALRQHGRKAKCFAPPGSSVGFLGASGAF